MTSSKSSLLTLGSVIALVAGPLGLPLGCDGEQKSSAPPAIAAGGTATTSGSGGAGNLGGTVSASSNGGTTTMPDIACTSDVECKALGLLCNKSTAKCVQCLQEADCASSSAGKFCDTAAGKCVACLASADCPEPATHDCVNQLCVAAKTCVNSLDCTTATAPICNRTTSRCVECVDTADCSTSGKPNPVCVTNRCQASCAATADCGSGLLCRTSATPAYCVACLSDADCPTSNTCSSGVCVVGGTSTTCAGNSAVPCAAVPAFTGAQVVDGYADDFCKVPGFLLAFDNTAGKINVASGETSGTTYPEKATFRVAFSATMIHVQIEVVDPSVNPNNNPAEIWNGDGVEFMISTSSTVTGLTSNDANTLHVIANSTIGVTVKASGSSGTHTQITDPNVLKAITTSQGYAVELKMLWPGGVTVTSGTAIYFDAALNSARLNAVDNTAPRVAQALLYQSANTANTTCTGTGNDLAPFCDDRLWCATKFQ